MMKLSTDLQWHPNWLNSRHPTFKHNIGDCLCTTKQAIKHEAWLHPLEWRDLLPAIQSPRLLLIKIWHTYEAVNLHLSYISELSHLMCSTCLACVFTKSSILCLRILVIIQFTDYNASLSPEMQWALIYNSFLINWTAGFQKPISKMLLISFSLN